MIHETTPIQPEQAAQAGSGPDGSVAQGYRDTLVVTYRGGGFQAEA
jgi:hypothetical protein